MFQGLLIDKKDGQYQVALRQIDEADLPEGQVTVRVSHSLPIPFGCPTLRRISACALDERATPSVPKPRRENGLSSITACGLSDCACAACNAARQNRKNTGIPHRNPRQAHPDSCNNTSRPKQKPANDRVEKDMNPLRNKNLTNFKSNATRLPAIIARRCRVRRAIRQSWRPPA